MILSRSSSIYSLVVLLCALTGCNTGTPAASGPKGLFEQHCAKCHAQAGEPGGPKLGSSKGPNLEHIGSEKGMSVTAIADYIRDPKSQDKDAKMPAFEGKLTEKEIRELAKFLAAQK